MPASRAVRAARRSDPQKVLPDLVLEQDAAVVMQVLFFGALLSAIKSTASATLLAPTVDLHREHLAPVRAARCSDRQNLLTHAHHGAAVQRCVCWPIAIRMQEHADLRAGVGRLPGARWSVRSCRWCAALYWKRATTQGALCADRARHRHLAAVPGHAAGAEALFPPQLWRACCASVDRHGARLAGAAGAGEQGHVDRPAAAPPWPALARAAPRCARCRRMIAGRCERPRPL